MIILNKEHDVTLSDVISFLVISWRPILIFCIGGFLISSVYIIVTPNQYQATLRMEMLKIPNILANKFEINYIEHPQTLINRLNSLQTFGEPIMSLCEFQKGINLFDGKSKVIFLNVPKGENGIINIRIRRQSPILAKKCAEIIYQYVIDSQKINSAPILKDYIAKYKLENQKKIDILNERLVQNRQFLNKLATFHNLNANTYFAVLSDTRVLEDSKNLLLNDRTLLMLNDLEKVPLPSINVSSSPIAPKKILSLVIGTVSGLFFGILFILIQRMIMVEKKFNAFDITDNK